LRTGPVALDLAVEAGLSPGVAGRADLLDTDPDRVLVAVGAHLGHALGLTRRLTLSPQRITRAAEVPGLSGRNRFAQRLVVHVRDHQHLAGGSVSGDAGHKAGRVEFGAEGKPLFAVDIARCRHGIALAFESEGERR